MPIRSMMSLWHSKVAEQRIPGGKPLQNSKTGVFIENPLKLQPNEPRVSSLFVNDIAKEFNGLRDLGEVSGLTGVRSARNSTQPVAPESDVAAFYSRIKKNYAVMPSGETRRGT
jgi:hypothetical protein